MKSITVSSPAKINLFLHILDRMPDGYHELETLFHRVSLSDYLTLTRIKKGNGIQIETNHPLLKNQKDNLIFRAHEALHQIVSWEGGVKVFLDKRIPVAAGLGGGSSNAAYFLLGMNRLFDLGLPLATLMRIGRSLGADVPFFLSQVNQSFGTRRGDVLHPCPVKKPLWLVITVPNFGVSTKEVYTLFSSRFLKKHKQNSGQNKEISATIHGGSNSRNNLHFARLCGHLTRITRFATITSVILESVRKNRQSHILRNHLFSASSQIRPELIQVSALFEKLGEKNYLMSGSGPSFFSVHQTKSEARQFAQKIKKIKPEFRVFACSTC